MIRHNLIRAVFDMTPRTYKGINRDGEHIIQIHTKSTTVYATLERLSDIELHELAKDLSIKVEKKTRPAADAI